MRGFILEEDSTVRFFFPLFGFETEEGSFYREVKGII
jgi:hypothetical protein